MRYTLVVQPEAEADASSIFDHLEEIKPGLGHHFLKALEELYQYIELFPSGFQKRRMEYRHGYLHRFPYRVAYVVEGDRIYVYQVRHMSRDVDPVFGP